MAQISFVKVGSRALGSCPASRQEIGLGLEPALGSGAHCCRGSWPTSLPCWTALSPVHHPLWLPSARGMKFSLPPSPALLCPPCAPLSSGATPAPSSGSCHAAPSPSSFLLCQVSAYIRPPPGRSPGVRSSPPHSHSARCPVALQGVTDVGSEPSSASALAPWSDSGCGVGASGGAMPATEGGPASWGSGPCGESGSAIHGACCLGCLNRRALRLGRAFGGSSLPGRWKWMRPSR